MKLKTHHVLVFSFLLILVVSCLPTSDDEILIVDDGIFQGTERDIKDLYTPEAVDSLRLLGLEINEGNNPPNLNGVYTTNQLILEATNRPNDSELGSAFASVRFAISNQNNDSLTLDFTGYTLATKYSVTESFISGNGNKFTVYLKAITEHEPTGSLAVFAYTFSGTKTNNGIENLSWALLMLDDSQDFSDIFIDNNEGRRFTNSDDVTKLICPIGNGTFNGTVSSLQNIFPAAAINTLLRDLRVPVNEGNSPPSLDGTYAFSPILQATTRTGLDENLVFEKLFDIEFKGQNSGSLKVDFNGKEYDTPNLNFDWLQGVESYISGSGRNFTIFSKVFEYDSELDYQPLSLYIFSGNVSDNRENIENFTYGLYMIDTGSNSNTFYIENGDARYFINDTSGSNKTNNKTADFTEHSELPSILGYR